MYEWATFAGFFLTAGKSFVDFFVLFCSANVVPRYLNLTRPRVVCMYAQAFYLRLFLVTSALCAGKKNMKKKKDSLVRGYNCNNMVQSWRGLHNVNCIVVQCHEMREYQVGSDDDCTFYSTASWREC